MSVNSVSVFLGMLHIPIKKPVQSVYQVLEAYVYYGVDRKLKLLQPLHQTITMIYTETRAFTYLFLNTYYDPLMSGHAKS